MFSHLVTPIVKKVLLNGLTILVRPVENLPKVSAQIWYHVGSKDEMTGEKGNAHLIEHMIFKGTNILSETDIFALTQRFSGYANAFTSYDYTAYVFEFPSHTWKESLTVFANCMRNCRFEEQMLNSELKAVIQELKMRRDNYTNALWQAMFSSIFFDHPYHFPIIGFKQDLWSLKRDDLFAFYKKHYVPNNATLVVVGDVNPEEVFVQAEKFFGSIPKDQNYKRKEFYHGRDLVAQNVTVYRDIEQPYVILMFEFPGLREKKSYEMSILSALLGEAKSSSLRKKLVDDLKIVTEFSTNVFELEDISCLYMFFCPKEGESIDKIVGLIQEHLQSMIINGMPKDELVRAEKQLKVGLLSNLEKISTQATIIGKDYVLTGDENYTLSMLSYESDTLENDIIELIKNYCSPAVMHRGTVLPLSIQAKKQWKVLQKLSDKEDERILDGRIRTIPVEDSNYANKLEVGKKKNFKYPKPEYVILTNGVRVLAVENANIPKIELVVSLNARIDRDSEELSGLYTLMCGAIIEGTKNYPGHTFAQEIEKYGMDFSVSPGFVSMSMLKEDFKKGLELLREALMYAEFDVDVLEKVRSMALAQLKAYWDKPSQYAFYLASKILYKEHPYSKCALGTVEGLKRVTRDDVIDFYKTFISSYKARIAVVGDFSGYNLESELEEALGTWQARQAPDQIYPEIEAIKKETVNHIVNRDQVVLMLFGKSVSRIDKDFDKFLLFDQIFGRGMASRLFRLREETGLFYSISGSLVGACDEQPGLFYVSTIVSLEKLEEAKKRIKGLLETVIDSLTEEELVHAKEAILNGQIANFETNKSMIGAFLMLDRYKLPVDYFDNRAAVLNAITLDEVKAAARRILNLDEMAVLQIGRVEEKDKVL